MSDRNKSVKGTRSIGRLAGMRDVLPDEYELRRAAIDKIERIFRSYGYKGIEVPIIEKSELQLRKSGETLRRSMYFLNSVAEDEGGDEISLRPELTASISRVFNAQLRSQPLPLRLYYIGPAFRHDRPQYGRFREFTHVGVELIGASGPEADAEVIALARDITEALGIYKYKILLGNMGVLIECLKAYQLQEKIIIKILESLENLGLEENKDESLHKLKEDLLDTVGDIVGTGASERELLDSLERIEDTGVKEDFTRIANWMLELAFENRPGAGVVPSRREPNVEGLMNKIRMMREREHIPNVIDFVNRMVDIKGKAHKVFPQVEALLRSYHLSSAPVEQLRDMTRYLDMYDIDWSRAEIDLGFGRGLAYYTGMIFEIHDTSGSLEKQKQICGGGRYDSLIGELSGRASVPALGFAFGLERLLLIKDSEVIRPRPEPLVFVVVIGDDKEIEYAISTARLLREKGICVEFCSPTTKLKGHTDRANRLGVPYVIYLGEDERLGNYVTVRCMTSGEQKQYSILDAANLVLSGGVK